MAKMVNVTSSNKNDIPLVVAEHGLGVVGGGVDGVVGIVLFTIQFE